MLPKVNIKKKQSIEKYKISNFIPEAMEKLLKTKSKISNEITKSYEDTVGEEIVSLTSIVKFQNGELTIKVRDAVLRNELSFREEEIKNSINCNKNKHLIVNKIIFK